MIIVIERVSDTLAGFCCLHFSLFALVVITFITAADSIEYEKTKSAGIDIFIALTHENYTFSPQLGSSFINKS